MNRNRAIVLLGGCAWAWLASTSASAQIAAAAISPTAGNNAKGNVTFTRHGDKVTVSAQLSGLSPGKDDASGNATLSAELSGLTIGGGSADIVGRSVVVHKDPDDYHSQPAGNSGPRIGCDVIHAS